MKTTSQCLTCQDMKRLAIREESRLTSPHLLELQRQLGPGKPAIYINCPDCHSGERKRQDYLDSIAEVPHRYKNWSLNDVKTEYQTITRTMITALQSKEWNWFLLHGGVGTGKSTLLAAAVNSAKAMNRSATYTTMNRILDHLKSTYDQGEGETDRFWNHLLSVEVLAIDEVDRFHGTDWARDRFNDLINARFEGDGVTIFATNRQPSEFPLYFQDRLNMARVVNLNGSSMRKVDEPKKPPARQEALTDYLDGPPEYGEM